jgi:hypothetical protein
MDPMIETTHWEHESVLDPRATPYYGIEEIRGSVGVRPCARCFSFVSFLLLGSKKEPPFLSLPLVSCPQVVAAYVTYPRIVWSPVLAPQVQLLQRTAQPDLLSWQQLAPIPTASLSVGVIREGCVAWIDPTH